MADWSSCRTPGIDSEESTPPDWELIPGLLKRFTNTGSGVLAVKLALSRTPTLYSTYYRAESRVWGMGSSCRTGTVQTLNLPYSVHIAELRFDCGTWVLVAELALFRPSIYHILYNVHIAELRLECGAGVLAVELALFRPSLNQQRLNCSEIGRWRMGNFV